MAPQTAEKVLFDHTDSVEPKMGDRMWIKTKQAMIAFAKAHVQAALEKAAKEATTVVNYVPAAESQYQEDIDRQSILNAYPLTNIQ